jgi:hypothetical protein
MHSRVILAGIAVVAMLALPVVAQVRRGGHRSHPYAGMSQSQSDAANAAFEASAAADAAAAAASENMEMGPDDNMAADMSYDANSDMSMDTNMTMDDMSMDTNMSMDMSPAPVRHRARRRGARRGH